MNLRVCIVGLGLMGGSLAWALRAHVPWLAGVDHDPAAVAAARVAGLLDAGTTDLATGVAHADLVVLATPVGAILEHLRALPTLRPNGCLVLDLGSTKRAICAAMDDLPPAFGALGGHPMCGKETAGFAAASADLFRGRTFVLSPTRRAIPAAWEAATALVAAVGAHALTVPADEHDRLVAVTSHLPYLLAGVLVRQAAAAAARDTRVWPVSAGGLRDTTRLAGTDPRVMGDILRTNREEIRRQLVAAREALAALQALIERADDDALARWLAETQAARRAYDAGTSEETPHVHATDGPG